VLALQGERDAMGGAVIHDNALEAFPVVASADKIANALRSRCDGVNDRVLPLVPHTASHCFLGCCHRRSAKVASVRSCV
jgi:hypothetical protein